MLEHLLVNLLDFGLDHWLGIPMVNEMENGLDSLLETLRVPYLDYALDYSLVNVLVIF